MMGMDYSAMSALLASVRSAATAVVLDPPESASPELGDGTCAGCSAPIAGPVCEHCDRVHPVQVGAPKKRRVIKADMSSYGRLVNVELRGDMNKIEHAVGCKIVGDMNNIGIAEDTEVVGDMDNVRERR